MRLIYFSNSRIPTEKAYGIQIMKMCQSFAGTATAVALLVPNRKNKAFEKADPFAYYQVKGNFEIKKIKSYDPNWIAQKMPPGFYIKIQAVFFMVNLLFYLLFKKDKAACIFYTRDEYLLPVLQLFSKRVVWEAHTLPRNSKYYLRYWRKCSAIIPVTHGLKNELVALGLSADQMLVAPDGVDLREFNAVQSSKKELRKQLGLPADKNIIMYTGHLYDWKGVQGLATAAKFLTDQELVVFIGGSAAETDLKKFREKNSGSQRISILGYQPYRQMPLYLKSADVLVLPNSANSQKSKIWTSPLKLFMYLASQVPIVAADLPSLGEILNQKNSFLYQADNPAALALVIRKVLTDRASAVKISAQAYADSQKHTWQNRAEKIITFIKAEHD